ncbi:hypothetical protein ACPOL_6072 [Acidisarcina polymorpha]|uniref:Uncharacterized protein n=1 Tax=Acidisarcina polymorpha TaxID=2211140 RepID=A0A2Z5G9R8_9BACT|nr:hypothetical protein [Acidisarcina polymorpha]AXC15316.1 hypothetical protein ACPOL_6072 [Acidisarcina polymorpha]
MIKTKANPLIQWIVVCGLVFAGAGASAPAQMPGHHPAYLHALRNLREARSLLQTNFGNPVHAQAAAQALNEIEHAINDLKNSAGADGKALQDVPPSNRNLPPAGRFHQVADLLRAAHNDVSGAESDPAAIQNRDGAERRIDSASAIIARVL